MTVQKHWQDTHEAIGYQWVDAARKYGPKSDEARALRSRMINIRRTHGGEDTEVISPDSSYAHNSTLPEVKVTRPKLAYSPNNGRPRTTDDVPAEETSRYCQYCSETKDITEFELMYPKDPSRSTIRRRQCRACRQHRRGSK